MLFFSFFKSLIGQEVTVELKNDLRIKGKLHSVDQYLNIKISQPTVEEVEKYPYLQGVRDLFVRGSVVRYIHLPSAPISAELLRDASRLENSQVEK